MTVSLREPSGVDLTELADDETWTSAGGGSTSTREAIEIWTAAARSRGDMVLFEVAEDDEPVGQIFLHDIDVVRGESLVGYHLLDASHRGRGIGSAAIALLIEHVRERTDLQTLVIITAGDNVRSRRVAEKNGFVLAGPPREDPTGACYKLAIR